ncbi:(Fe-S)-binding protein, partial [Candidatus Solincola tengchongensis]|uniref:(Fe-S)-binding protein n=1 Tax=Candidatus Solincola tengchongensis TaxID=2900693 RepID=UPI00257EAEE5
MERGVTRKREKLTDYRDDYWVCGKCKMCQSINVQKFTSARFSANCPCGTRYRFESYYAAGMMEIARAITNLEFEPTGKTAEIIYSCNLCGLCQEMCFPLKGLHTTRIIQLMREKAVEEGWGPLPSHGPLLESTAEKDNPFGVERGFKGRAVRDLGIKDLTREKAENLLFIGCAYAAPGQERRLAALVGALRAADLDFGVLGDDEPCCRSLNLALGDRDGFEEHALENIELFRSTGAERIITACPHCLQVFRDEYSRVMELESVHATEVLARALKKGSFAPRGEWKLKGVYHDPCFLGRWCEIYDAPRRLLSAVPGLELLEFERNL